MLDTCPTLEGSTVSLVPNRPDHDQALHAITPEETFRYFVSAPADASLGAFVRYMAAHRDNPKSRVFTVRSAATGAVLGSTACLDIDPKNRCVEIGSTWYTPAARGSAVNPECKLLLLEHALDTLGCVRVTLKCDARNLASQGAIAKLGAVREGVLRSHRITHTGFVRDTVMYSVVPADWASVRVGLEARIKTR
jgi:RimJ/RimL family protein N-acetyltransferase